MRKMAILILAAMIAGCATAKSKPVTDNNIVPVSPYTGKWIDTETNSITEIALKGDIPVVISVTDYSDIQEKDGEENYKVTQSSFENGVLQWSYFVPSTNYTVNFKVTSSETNKLKTQWNNLSPEGETSNGLETLIRVDENLVPLEAPEQAVDQDGGEDEESYDSQDSGDDADTGKTEDDEEPQYE